MGFCVQKSDFYIDDIIIYVDIYKYTTQCMSAYNILYGLSVIVILV